MKQKKTRNSLGIMGIRLGHSRGAYVMSSVKGCYAIVDSCVAVTAGAAGSENASGNGSGSGSGNDSGNGSGKWSWERFWEWFWE